MNVLKLPCQGASRSVTSLLPKKQHIQESGPMCQVPKREWQGGLKNGSAPPAPPVKPAEHTHLPVSPTAAGEGKGALPQPSLRYRRRRASPASTHLLWDLFLLPGSYHLLGKGKKNPRGYINQGHHGEIQNQSGFEVRISKSILGPEIIRTYGLCSSNEAVTCSFGTGLQRRTTGQT